MKLTFFLIEKINFSNSIKYSELRLLPGETLKEKVFESRDQIINSIFIKTSKKQLNLKLVEIDVLEEKPIINAVENIIKCFNPHI